MGRCVKIIVAYDYLQEFWRGSFHISTHYGSTADVRDLGYVHNIFKSKVGPYPALVMLVTGAHAESYMLLSESERRHAVFAQLAHMYDCDISVTSNFVEFVEKDWSGDAYSSGCFAGILPAGVLTTLREHIYNSSFDGDVHWASTEIAVKHYGYMEGALVAGKTAAEGCLSNLALPSNRNSR